MIQKQAFSYTNSRTSIKNSFLTDIKKSILHYAAQSLHIVKIQTSYIKYATFHIYKLDFRTRLCSYPTIHDDCGD